MKKKIPLLLMLVFAAAEAQDCCEEEVCCVEEPSFYVKVFGGANFLQNTTINRNRAHYQTGYIVAGSLGYRSCYCLRFEAEYAYRRNAIRKIEFIGDGSSKHGYFQASSIMANLYWDLPCLFWNIHPYVGAGLGADFQKMHSSNSRIIFNQKWTHFSSQAMAGFAFPLFCNTDIAVEYKFHYGGCHIYNHAVGIGLTYKFGCL